MLTVSLIDDDDDDHTFVRHSVAADKQFRFLSAYATAEEALTHLPKEPPDVALVDIALPGIGGIECVRRLMAIVPAMPTQFLMLTGYEDDNLIFDALKTGVHGYLLKARTSGKQLMAAIKDVFEGGGPMTSSVARKVIASFKLHDDSLSGLTKREEDVLRLLAGDLTYKEIADQLLISTSTMCTHVNSIYHKLHVHSRIAAVQYVAREHRTYPKQDHRL